MTGASPVASAKMARFEDAGDEGLSEPAAKTPEEASDENANAEMMPTKLFIGDHLYTYELS